MLLLPDQTYEDEYLTFGHKYASQEFPKSCTKNYTRSHRRRLHDDVGSITSMCEDFLVQYGVRPDFFCKYRNRNGDRRNKRYACKYLYVLNFRFNTTTSVRQFSDEQKFEH